MRVLILFLTLLVMSAPAMAESLLLATTTSTDNTGLLDDLAPVFQADTGIELKWSAMGTGKALQFGKDCNCDALLVHAPPAEKQYVADGYGVDRREVMYNDFVIIGPASDPAGVKGMDVTKALTTIAKEKAAFMSRGDNSGTNKKELSLWKSAGMAVPDKESWYVQTGQGMIKTIGVAEERKGYTMTDRGTFIKYAHNHGGNPPLVVLVEGDAVLFNQYSVMGVSPERCKDVNAKAAKAFADWLVSPATQQKIADFRLLGQPLFIPNAK